MTASAPSTARLAAWLVAVAILVGLAALPGLDVRATYGAQVTADEPHYLLTAISLAEDGDLDVSDETADERYRAFHEIGLPPQAAADADGTMVEPHDPLLPAMLAVPWSLGGWRAAKAALALLLGVAAAVTTWIAVRRRDVAVGLAAPVTAMLFASAPLAVYGTQVYPEVPAALAVAVAVAAGLGPPHRRNALTVALAVIALPWLSIKYTPVAAALAALIAWRWWRGGGRRLVGATLGALSIAAVVYVTAHLAWYGGLTVYAAGDYFRENGGELTVVGLAPDYLGRARRLVGLLLDRDFGLVVWQPAYLLLPAAFLGAVRRRRPRPDTWLVVTPLAVGWLTATFIALTMQGWWFPGRQVVVVLPLAVVLMAELAARGRRWLLAALALGVPGLVTLGWLWRDGLDARLTLVVDFARVSDPLFRTRRALLPDYLDVTTRTWLLQAIGTMVMGVVAWWAWRPHDPVPREPTAERAPVRVPPRR